MESIPKSVTHCVSHVAETRFKVDNRWSRYSVIQNDDSWVRSIVKFVFLFFMLKLAQVFTAYFSRAFDEIAHKITQDALRMDLQFNHIPLAEQAWRNLQEREAELELTQEAKALLQFGSCAQAKKFISEEEFDAPEAITRLQSVEELIKGEIKDKIIPEIFHQLENKYGKLRALEILDMFHQSLPHMAIRDIYENYVKGKLDSKRGKLKNILSCQSKVRDEQSYINLTLDELEMRTYLALTADSKQDRIEFATIPVEVSGRLTSNEFKLMLTIQVDQSKLVPEQIEELEKAWGVSLAVFDSMQNH